MRILHLPSVLLIFASSLAATAPAASPPKWNSDGVRSCQFDASVTPVRCTQYHQVVKHQPKGGEAWREYRYMWKGPHGLEVSYSPRTGLVGISNFTIGELVDPTSRLPGHASKNAVSYAPSREELIIGVPGEGYEFSVEGGSF